MSRLDNRLMRHLAVAIALKLVVLAVLWWAFVRDTRVEVDAVRAAAHIGAAAPLQGTSP